MLSAKNIYNDDDPNITIAETRQYTKYIYIYNDYKKNKNLVDIMRFFTIYTNIYIIEQLTVKKRITLRCDNLQK